MSTSVDFLGAPWRVEPALCRYHANYRDDWRNTWCIWIPGHIVTYVWAAQPPGAPAAVAFKNIFAFSEVLDLDRSS